MIEGATHTVLQFLKDLGCTAAALHASRLSRVVPERRANVIDAKVDASLEI
jgi:hypothetical protein